MMNFSSKQQVEKQSQQKALPDITSHVPAEVKGALERVGMSNIEVPVRILDAHGQYVTTPAKASFYVSLDKEDAKGIHMSRLYLLGQEYLANQELNEQTLKSLTKSFLDSHKGLSLSASTKVTFDYILRRPALLSQNAGWRFYPVSFEGINYGTHFDLYMTVQIAYSSTCPCSAALSRQLIQNKFDEKFEDQEVVNKEDVMQWLETEGLAATPHGQRSLADVTIKVKEGELVSLLQLINNIEESISTPVQTAVKREDEQEFARLNAENLMFCEDAARRIKSGLELLKPIEDYRVKVAHLESLHAHDAVAIVTKGLSNGLRP